MDKADAFDIGLPTEPPSEMMGVLKQQVIEAYKLSHSIDYAEEQLADLKSRLHSLQCNGIPDSMLGCSLSEFVLESADINIPLKVSIKQIVSGTLPKDPEKRANAIAWLVLNDGGGLIKTSLSIEFGRSQHQDALDTAQRLRQEGNEVLVSEGVHSQTLGKYARDRLKDGDPIDFDVLGLYTGKVAEIKEAKKK